jgi:hypothetical protein
MAFASRRPTAPRWPFALIFVGVLAVVAIGGTAVGAALGLNSWGLPFAFGVVFASAALLSLVLVLSFAAYNRARLRHIRTMRPEAEVFTATRVDGFMDALAGVPGNGRGVGTAFGVSIGLRGIELWRNGTLETPAYLLDWAKVTGVTTGYAVIRNPRNQTVSVPALFLSRVDGPELPLTVARAGNGYPESEEFVAALASRLQQRVPRR